MKRKPSKTNRALSPTTSGRVSRQNTKVNGNQTSCKPNGALQIKPTTAKKLQKILNEELRCSVCYEVFKNPRTLSTCLHSFCQICLQRMLSRRSKFIHCPLCRKKTALPRRGVKSLPLNSVIRRLIDSLQSEGVIDFTASCPKRILGSAVRLKMLTTRVKQETVQLCRAVTAQETRISREVDKLFKRSYRLEKQKNELIRTARMITMKQRQDKKRRLFRK